jgi:hypothetical protein
MASVLALTLFAFVAFFRETVAVNHRLPRIFLKSAIGPRLFAKQKPRAFAGDDFPDEGTNRTEAHWVETHVHP